MRHFILYLLFNFKQFNHDHASKLRPNCQDFVCPSVLEYIFSCPKSNHPKFELSHQRSKFMKIYFIMYLIKFIRYCKHHCSFLQIWSNLGWFVLRQLKIHYIPGRMEYYGFINWVLWCLWLILVRNTPLLSVFLYSDERSTLYFYKELLHEQFVGNIRSLFSYYRCFF